MKRMLRSPTLSTLGIVVTIGVLAIACAQGADSTVPPESEQISAPSPTSTLAPPPTPFPEPSTPTPTTTPTPAGTLTVATPSPEPEVSRWKCETQPLVETLKWSSDGKWAIFPREPLKTPFRILTNNDQASDVALQRAEWVAENLDLNDDRFVIAVANAILELRWRMLDISSGGRFEPTPDKAQRFGELLKSEMNRRRQGAFQVYPCVMPVFLEMVDKGRLQFGKAVATQTPVGQFIPPRSMTEARLSHTATLLNDGTVLVAGGGGTEGVLATAEVYDPSSGTWTASRRMAQARSFHTASLLGGWPSAGRWGVWW
jgi:hypothetical protein